MLSAVFATVLFAFSAVSGARVAKLMGGTEANFWRLSLATLFLAALAHGLGAGLGGNGFYIFILSGCVGFGLGDVALFAAYPRLGSRLTILIVHCLAAPFAGLVEWLWLGTTLTLAQMGCGAVILTGVAVALAPEHETQPSGSGIANACRKGLRVSVARCRAQTSRSYGKSVRPASATRGRSGGPTCGPGVRSA